MTDSEGPKFVPDFDLQEFLQEIGFEADAIPEPVREEGLPAPLTENELILRMIENTRRMDEWDEMRFSRRMARRCRA